MSARSKARTRRADRTRIGMTVRIEGISGVIEHKATLVSDRRGGQRPEPVVWLWVRPVGGTRVKHELKASERVEIVQCES